MMKLFVAISITLLPSVAYAQPPIPQCTELELVALEATIPEGCPIHLVSFEADPPFDLAVDGGPREAPRVVTREAADAAVSQQSCSEEPGAIFTNTQREVVLLHTVDPPAGARAGTAIWVVPNSGFSSFDIQVPVTAAGPCPAAPAALDVMSCPEACDAYYAARGDGGCSAGGPPALALAGLALLLQRFARRRCSSSMPSRSVSRRMPK